MAPRLYWATWAVMIARMLFFPMYIALSVTIPRLPNRHLVRIMAVAQAGLAHGDMEAFLELEDSLYFLGIRTLHVVAAFSSLGSLAWLVLKANVDVDVRDGEENPPTLCAVEAGELGSIRSFLYMVPMHISLTPHCPVSAQGKISTTIPCLQIMQGSS